jgi:hypothetical protein
MRGYALERLRNSAASLSCDRVRFATQEFLATTRDTPQTPEAIRLEIESLRRAISGQ